MSRVQGEERERRNVSGKDGIWEERWGIIVLPMGGYPSCLQNTIASVSSIALPQNIFHSPSMQNSARPWFSISGCGTPGTSSVSTLTSPSRHPKGVWKSLASLAVHYKVLTASSSSNAIALIHQRSMITEGETSFWARALHAVHYHRILICSIFRGSWINCSPCII